MKCCNTEMVEVARFGFLGRRKVFWCGNCGKVDAPNYAVCNMHHVCGACKYWQTRQEGAHVGLCKAKGADPTWWHSRGSTCGEWAGR